DADDAVALARLASSALDVEREAPRPVAAHARFGQLREQFADMGEEAGVGRGIGSRRAPDRALVNVDHLVQVLDALDAAMGAGAFAGAVEFLRQRAIERV